ncbi:DNA mismatch repair protein MutS [Streptococcus himalayensis]|uniref:DNA mismatch repair protein MutS n=1 Tax=Streptococcus himalayensis TaxID=1888195 RepID=A0A917A2B5_9STRE|nr:DNA mismatch repair protein MutS [Streptococcus himalayensis]GGE23294.1 DNA mismatch repair protein MutS [Streptococcus himalayensis]
MATEKISPGMQQYLGIKKDYPDAFLLFRMGDFYELFYEDAINAAQILEISLTSRNKNAENPIPMAGVPYHSAQQYIDTLVESGYKVAIAEQVEEPQKAVGVVKREVVQVITPGTVVDSSKPDSQNNFLVALDKEESQYGLSYMDVATGEFQVTTLTDFSMVCGEIRNLRAREIVLGYALSETEETILAQQMNLLLSQVASVLDDARLLGEQLTPLEYQTAGKLLEYVHRTQMRELSHLKKVHHYEIRDFLQMDFATKSSLDLTENARTGKKHGSLYWLLDETKTAMGTRLLRTWIQNPLIDKERISHRQDVVQVFLENFFERSDLAESLKGVYDIERLASRVSFGKTSPKDLLQLAATLGNVPQIKSILEGLSSPILALLIERLDPIPELESLISSAISPDAQASITDGNIIQTGFDELLDKYRVVLRDGTSWIAELEAREREESGITNLKIDYNKKDGYYFHVTNSQIGNVPAHFFRKATLKNSERYGTEELARIEGEMLEAREKSANLEYEIFMRIRAEVGKYIGRLQKLAQTLATVDVLQGFATVAEKQQLVRPEFTQKSAISIAKGRHAVVEKVMGAQTYIPNSLSMEEGTNIQLITGPNMSGKSTYMRQLAMIAVMAQMGSYVPAERAVLPIFDAIFTRIGAADDLVSGQSTFMVEMMEANHAIRHATEHSLILFDELGRGTATYDGMALAQAIIEYIHDRTGAKTLFATHYHELTDLSARLSHLENVHVATLEKDGQVTFLHKIEQGPADKSYGIHVAKIAGMPDELLERADHILTQLENQDRKQPELLDQAEIHEQITLFEEAKPSDAIAEKLGNLDIYNMTPLDVVRAVERLQQELKQS